MDHLVIMMDQRKLAPKKGRELIALYIFCGNTLVIRVLNLTRNLFTRNYFLLAYIPYWEKCMLYCSLVLLY